MQLVTFRQNGISEVGILLPAGIFPVKMINTLFQQTFPPEMFLLIQTGGIERLRQWYDANGPAVLEKKKKQCLSPREVRLTRLYPHPGKIWGIGLNYRTHADELDETVPTSAPASFMRPDTTIVDYGGEIRIPVDSEKTTAEGELGIIIGKQCKDVDPDRWLEVVAGFTTITDVTAEDILRRNPRYLTLSKSFDTFFSFGPSLLTPDEIPDVEALEVSTVLNGDVRARDTVSNMMFSPRELVAFHSRVMTLQAGDVISTGTPGAVTIRDGDTVECRIGGFVPLMNRVRDLKIEHG